MSAKRTRARALSAVEQLDAFIDAYTSTVAGIARGALAKLRKQLPGAVELVGDRYTGLAIGFSPTERAADAVLGIVLYPRWVNLFFLRGAKLRDPTKRLQGAGTIVRHIVLHDPMTLDDEDVRALVEQACAQARTDFPRRRRLVIKPQAAKRASRRPRIRKSRGPRST